MKKTAAAALIACSALLLYGCGNGQNTVSIKDKDIRLEIDDKYTVKAESKKGDTITWSSNDDKVAVVGPDGTVTAVGNGITTVTASGKNGYAHVGIIVGGDDTYVDADGNEMQTFNGESDIEKISGGVKAGGKDDISVKKGEKHTLVATTTPSGIKDKLVWKTADKKVATVSEKGELEAVGAGKTAIRVYAPNGVYGELIVRVR